MNSTLMKWGVIAIVFVSLLGYIGWLKYDNEKLQSTIQALELSNESLQTLLSAEEQRSTTLSNQILAIYEAQENYESDLERNRQIVNETTLVDIDINKGISHETWLKVREVLNAPPSQYRYK